MNLDVSNPGPFRNSLAVSTRLPRRKVSQKTLKTSIGCAGVGLHSGARVSLKLHPAPANSGIVFKRIDLIGGGAEIPARWTSVTDSRLCTVIADTHGVSIATVEHLMAALYGMGVDNALIELNGPEVPAMDGSAWPFMFLIECAGLAELDAPRQALRIRKPKSFVNGGKLVSFAPAQHSLQIDFEIDFKAAAIGRQTCAFRIDPEVFKTEISRARTFGLLSEVTALREAGLARGGSLDNAIVVDGDRILNDEGLRHANEFVRHKVLDVVGDLYMSGYPIIGHFSGHCSSHADTARLMRLVLADRSSWEIVDMREDQVSGSWQNTQPLAAMA
ncbi:MAG: UDP-3-O-acyl-N-acetylglucosamine deacetylase [Rhodospirillaceae bacterium]|nr:UDP-3-O-acyl-N-acetylglucosamine deacetylase [Rhodospirillaceae bacterium]